jgi:hypothetical protein
MTPTTFHADTTYRIATDRQAVLRQEAAQAHATQINDRPASEPAPQVRGTLVALLRRLAGAVSFA